MKVRMLGRLGYGRVGQPHNCNLRCFWGLSNPKHGRRSDFIGQEWPFLALIGDIFAELGHVAHQKDCNDLALSDTQVALCKSERLWVSLHSSERLCMAMSDLRVTLHESEWVWVTLSDSRDVPHIKTTVWTRPFIWTHFGGLSDKKWGRQSQKGANYDLITTLCFFLRVGVCHTSKRLYWWGRSYDPTLGSQKWGRQSQKGANYDLIQPHYDLRFFFQRPHMIPFRVILTP